MANFFEKPKPKQNIFFNGYLYPADDRGKCLNATRMLVVIGPEYVWLGRELSIPLDWSLRMEVLGPGFALSWINPLNQKQEVMFLCIRTFFGYDKDKTGKFRQALETAVGQFKGHSTYVTGQEVSSATACQICGAFPAQIYDFDSTLSFFLSFWIRPKRYLLCPLHGGRVFFRTFWINMVLSFFGVVGWLGVTNRKNCRTAFSNGALSEFQKKLHLTATLLPAAMLLFLILLVIFNS